MLTVQNFKNKLNTCLHSTSENIKALGEWSRITPCYNQTTSTIRNLWNGTAETVKTNYNSLLDYITNNAAHFRARPVEEIKISLDDSQAVSGRIDTALDICREIQNNQETRSNYVSATIILTLTSYIATFIAGELLPAYPPLVLDGPRYPTRAPLLVVSSIFLGALSMAAIASHLRQTPEDETQNQKVLSFFGDLLSCKQALKDEKFMEFAKQKYPNAEFTLLELANRYKEFQTKQ